MYISRCPISKESQLRRFLGEDESHNGNFCLVLFAIVRFSRDMAKRRSKDRRNSLFFEGSLYEMYQTFSPAAMKGMTFLYCWSLR